MMEQNNTAVINSGKKDVILWLSICSIARTGSFRKEIQDTFREWAGDETLNKVKSFFVDVSLSEAVARSTLKLKHAVQHFSSIAPENFESSFSGLCRVVGDKFCQPDFESYILDQLNILKNEERDSGV